MDDVIFKYRNIPDMTDIKVAMSNGSYDGWKKALRMGPEAVIEVVKQSGLRGRGGAGFPTGLKWSFMPKEDGKPHYLLANADESEPGTFKDREIMLKLPHCVIEGAAIGAMAIRAKRCFIYMRGEYLPVLKVMEKALAQAYQERLLGRNILGSGIDVDIEIYRGAGAYICGEESAMLDSIQGDRGHPRERPPFPAQVGAWGMPTTVNNVETLSPVGAIILNGPEWYRKWGTEKSPGTKIFSVSGHVNKPGNYELPLGTSLRKIIFDHAGGVRGNKKIKCIIPGGSSTPFLDSSKIDTKMDYESVTAAGSMLGSGGIIVIDEDTDIVKVALRVAQFYAHESCGKCTPCHQGTWWLTKILKRMLDRKGSKSDLDLILDVCDNMLGKCFCLLGDACAMPVTGAVKTFRDEFESHIS